MEMLIDSSSEDDSIQTMEPSFSDDFDDGGNEEKNQVLRNESSSQVYCNQPAQIGTAIEPSRCSFPPETILSSQEHNLVPQGMYDPPSNNPNILSWFNPRGASVCVPLPNFVNWGIPPCAVPPNFSMPRHPFDSPSNSALREQHNSVTRKLSFDINKGSEHISFHISV
ncbi:protein FAR1-RELATED SEQUENCE 5-like isoform X1 [Carex littledalei]|uniref:Protein FAR1-RELATED SEQUENCE 5-like isoform X1 n=1 Tax=Carex littledalei TaxID=544730 RepID=A0A833QXK7_9POAL|nr:protein FAR1-RELATED SEQUENCE 5-like isoform X1 [Carex littledalei]